MKNVIINQITKLFSKAYTISQIKSYSLFSNCDQNAHLYCKYIKPCYLTVVTIFFLEYAFLTYPFLCLVHDYLRQSTVSVILVFFEL